MTTYDRPFETHARMEPINATVHVQADRVDVWSPTQDPMTVREEVAKAAQSLVEFPPMQKGASFNLEGVKAQIQAAIAAQTGK